jgi:hypothetical protein
LTPLLAVPDKVAQQDDFSEDGPLEKKRGKKRK